MFRYPIFASCAWSVVFIYILKHTEGPLSLIRISTESEREARGGTGKQRYIETLKSNPTWPRARCRLHDALSQHSRGLSLCETEFISYIKLISIPRKDSFSSAHFTYLRAQQFTNNQDGGLVQYFRLLPFSFPIFLPLKAFAPLCLQTEKMSRKILFFFTLCMVCLLFAQVITYIGRFPLTQ